MAAADNHCDMTVELPKSSEMLDEPECEGTLSSAVVLALEGDMDY